MSKVLGIINRFHLWKNHKRNYNSYELLKSHFTAISRSSKGFCYNNFSLSSEKFSVKGFFRSSKSYKSDLLIFSNKIKLYILQFYWIKSLILLTFSYIHVFFFVQLTNIIFDWILVIWSDTVIKFRVMWII